MSLLISSGHSYRERLTKRESVQDRIHLQKSQPYIKEEPGFFSRIASWIYPFGGSSNKEPDSIPSPGRQSASYLPPPNKVPPKYLPPENLSPPSYNRPNQIPKDSSDCNPCNREPWIPIPGKSGRTNVINFVPQNEVGLNPHPQYGPPNQLPNSINAITAFDRPSTHQEFPKGEYIPPDNQPLPEYGVPNIEITPSVLVGSLSIPPNSPISFNQYVPVGGGNRGPETPSTFPQLPNTYGPPSFQFRGKETPHPINIPQIRDHMIPPPVKTQDKNYLNIVGMRPPPPPTGFTTQLVPIKQNHQNPNSIQDILQPPVSQYSVLNEEFPPYTSKPIDAYSTPDIHGIEQIPLSSGDNDEFGYPIAFPNLSIRPLVPLHNHIQFRQSE